MPDARTAAASAATAATPARPAPTRAELLGRWQQARRRRENAPLGSEEYRLATIEVGEIEVTINALDVEASEGRQVKPAHRGEKPHS